MRRAFVESKLLQAAQSGAAFSLPDDVIHRFARILRLETGAPVELFDGAGLLVRGVFDRQLGVLQQIQVIEVPSGGPSLVVAQALAKGDKLDHVVRQTTEIGATSIWLYESSRSIVRITEKSENRTERLVRIADDAARQSLRTHVPTVEGPLHFSGLCQKVRGFVEDGIAVFGYIGAEETLSSVLASSPHTAKGGVLVIVGPEGGLSAEEANQLTQAGAVAVSLGASVLRTETAGVVMLAAAQVSLGRL